MFLLTVYLTYCREYSIFADSKVNFYPWNIDRLDFYRRFRTQGGANTREYRFIEILPTSYHIPTLLVNKDVLKFTDDIGSPYTLPVKKDILNRKLSNFLSSFCIFEFSNFSPAALNFYILVCIWLNFQDRDSKHYLDIDIALYRKWLWSQRKIGCVWNGAGLGRARI